METIRNTDEIHALLESWHERGEPTLKDVIECIGEGPFTTKAGAQLFKLLELDALKTNDDFLQFEHPTNKAAEPDIRGFRLYSVLGQAAGTVGGTEFHRQRQEMVFGIAGEFEWVCEDLFGNRQVYPIKPGFGVWLPPFILHTFTSLKGGSGLIVACNTRFDATDKRTHDTWTKDVFTELQTALRAKT